MVDFNTHPIMLTPYSPLSNKEFFWPLPLYPPLLSRSLVLKVVIPVKTGIQESMARHDYWIPTYVGMTKRLKNSTYDTKPNLREARH